MDASSPDGYAARTRRADRWANTEQPAPSECSKLRRACQQWRAKCCVGRLGTGKAAVVRVQDKPHSVFGSTRTEAEAIRAKWIDLYLHAPKRQAVQVAAGGTPQGARSVRVKGEVSPGSLTEPFAGSGGRPVVSFSRTLKRCGDSCNRAASWGHSARSPRRVLGFKTVLERVKTLKKPKFFSRCRAKWGLRRRLRRALQGRQLCKLSILW